METLFVKGLYRNSRILVGEPLSSLKEYIPGRNVFIITDKNLHRLYAGHIPDYPAYVMEPGENSKKINTVAKICKWLMDEGAGRDAFILGVGGGVVCDMTGFVASIFLRGVEFGFVATSLMAQIDASIGGKNGVNLNGYKNIMGTFKQPAFVMCDTTMLSSLPKAELKHGLAEAVKHSLISDRQMFNLLKENAESVLKLDEDAVYKLVNRSIKTKIEIVNKDEVEQGERRKLNLGHTWGHAVEKTDGIPHGQAISIGLAFAAKLSVHRGKLSTAEHKEIVSLLMNLGLPVASATSPKTIFKALLKDKKKETDHIHFVLMEGIGDVVVEPIPIQELKDFVRML
ncbi:MAG: 3-dehydroquinate synthase [Bacteroidales bacterium]